MKILFLVGAQSRVRFFDEAIRILADRGHTVQLTGPSEKCDAFIRAIGESTILEVVRSGVSGIGRGEKILRL